MILRTPRAACPNEVCFRYSAFRLNTACRQWCSRPWIDDARCWTSCSGDSYTRSCSNFEDIVKANNWFRSRGKSPLSCGYRRDRIRLRHDMLSQDVVRGALPSVKFARKGMSDSGLWHHNDSLQWQMHYHCGRRSFVHGPTFIDLFSSLNVAIQYALHHGEHHIPQSSVAWYIVHMHRQHTNSSLTGSPRTCP